MIAEDEQKVIKITVDNVFETLRKNGFEIKEQKSAFQRTEQLLYLAPSLKEAINHNKNKIKDLERFGLPKGGSAVHIVPITTPIKQDEDEIIAKEINKIKQRNHIINSQLKWINEITNTLKDDKFYKILDLKYSKGKTLEEIAEYFMCDVSTVSRNKNKLIRQISSLLFANESISELGI